jgi:hypothetical protein
MFSPTWTFSLAFISCGSITPTWNSSSSTCAPVLLGTLICDNANHVTRQVPWRARRELAEQAVFASAYQTPPEFMQTPRSPRYLWTAPEGPAIELNEWYAFRFQTAAYSTWRTCRRAYQDPCGGVGNLGGVGWGSAANEEIDKSGTVFPYWSSYS